MQTNRKVHQSCVVAGWLTMLCCCSWLAAVGAAQTLDTAKPLRAALNLMDEATVSDLFGKPTSRDFYALHVRIFNNLDRDTDGRQGGKPILVYSDSIEVAVGLEAKEAFTLASRKPSDFSQRWRELSPADSNAIQSYNPPAAPQTEKAHPVPTIKETRKVAFLLPEEVSIPPGTKVYWWSENSNQISGDNCDPFKNILTMDANGIGTIHQKGLAMVSAIVGEKRYSRIVRVTSVPETEAPLANTGLLQIRLQPESQLENGSSLTVSRPAEGNLNKMPGAAEWKFFNSDDAGKLLLKPDGDALLVTGKINGTTALVAQIGEAEYACAVNVVPVAPVTQMFRLSPYPYGMMVNSVFMSASPVNKTQSSNASAAQRRNFAEMTMKPRAVTPFGADISRVIFFPKSPFRGMLKDRLTRINRIDTSYFNITVAILDKNTATYNAVLSNNRE